MTVEGWVATNRVGSRTTFRVKIDDEDLAGYADEESRNAFIDSMVYEEMVNHVQWGWNPS